MNISNSFTASLKGIRSAYTHKNALSKALIVPLSLYVVFSANLEFLKDYSSQSILATVALFALELFFGTVIVLITHRVILISREPVVKLVLLTFKVLGRFILANVVITLFCLPAGIFLFVPVVGKAIAIIVVAYIFSRSSLVFPSIAVGNPMTVTDSWDATIDYQALVFISVGVLGLIFGISERFLSVIVPYTFVVEIFTVLTWIIVIGAISEAYRVIVIDTQNI